MRITGGTYRGRPIKTLSNVAIRPTSDKIRQAIFNILMNDIEEKSVLDIFAGSGALGIEAFSRGAHSAVFVEIGHPQAEMIGYNLKTLSLNAEIVEADYVKACRLLNERGLKFDIIFADPPYAKVTPSEIIEVILEYGLLGAEGFLIIEHKSGADIANDKMIILKNRKFGQTEVTFYVRKKD
ncbi:MAG: 16S rRNA (guanine(966)-N(2))-methyltransferase RsmD [candidate division Zixibacteria bacterium]|nr:16S rRNA (guanine(966)-N(2))-methyltransferase RsmD [candidate division Zixibacteria bacterium]